MRIAFFFVLISVPPVFASSPRLVAHPESLAGRWEASDGNGGEVGINILLTTTVASSTADLVEAAQKLEDFQVGVYQRAASTSEAIEWNFFTDSPIEGATWDGRTLRIACSRADAFGIDVNLVWSEAAETWSGRFERGAFKSQAVVLKRSAARHHSPFVGTWFEGDGLMNNCLHIIQAPDGTLSGWGDDILVPARLRYARGLLPPREQVEHYGEIARLVITPPKPHCS